MTNFSKTSRGLAIVIGLWAASGSPVLASGKVLPIGVAEFPPFKYTAPDGKIVGADTEIIEYVFKRMGYTPNIHMQPWTRVQAAGERGDFSAIYSFTKTPEREQLYYFSDPINSVRDVFYKKQNTPLTWRTFEDLKTMRVATSAGYEYAQVFKDAVAERKFQVVHEASGENPDLVNLKNLMAGRVDIAICEISVCQHLIRAHKAELGGIDYIPQGIGPVRTFHVGFSKKWPGAEKLAKQFNEELRKLVASGQRKKIYKKYNIATNLP